MSSITSNSRTQVAGRPAAVRAAEGVITSYIQSLIRDGARPSADAKGSPNLDLSAAHTYDCGASRNTGMAARRRLALRRAPLPA